MKYSVESAWVEWQKFSTCDTILEVGHIGGRCAASPQVRLRIEREAKVMAKLLILISFALSICFLRILFRASLWIMFRKHRTVGVRTWTNAPRLAMGL